jgi:hypothetical protein
MIELDGAGGDAREIHEAEKLLGDLRQALMRLHKVLLDWERRGYERIHGRQSSHDMLQVLLSDSQFAWLRPISQLIVRIDELLSEPTPPMRNDVDAIVAAVRTLTSPNENGNTYERRYDMALQQLPDAVVAHGDVRSLLRSGN